MFIIIVKKSLYTIFCNSSPHVPFGSADLGKGHCGFAQAPPLLFFSWLVPNRFAFGSSDNQPPKELSLPQFF